LGPKINDAVYTKTFAAAAEILAAASGWAKEEEANPCSAGSHEEVMHCASAAPSTPPEHPGRACDPRLGPELGVKLVAGNEWGNGGRVTKKMQG
jgi:hypothetical protein